MKWRVVSVGKPAHAWVRDGVSMYLERIQRFAPVEPIVLKRNDPALFDKAVEGGLVVALDERGLDLDTTELAERVTAWELDRVKQVSVCVGGADGLDSAFRARADLCLRFGRATLMHELALLVWMEQLYRVYTLKQDHPYHREG